MLLALILAVQASQAPVRVGGNIPPPQRIKYVGPVYPESAISSGAQGVVIIEAIVGPDGKISQARVVRSIVALDQAALEAVKQWEYTPTVINGVAVPVIMTVTVNFAIQGGRPSTPPGAAASTAGTDAAQAPTTGALRLAAVRSGDGLAVWEITPERAAALPRWALPLGPPIAIHDAIRIAGDWLAARPSAPQHAGIQSATLARGPSSGGKAELWFYQVNFINGTSSRVPGDQIVRVLVLMDGTVVEPRTEPIPAGGSTPRMPATVAAGAGGPAQSLAPPIVVSRVDPEYTEEARRLKISGSVLVGATVLADGSLSDVHIVRSLDSLHGLDEAAIKAVKQFTFKAGMRDGAPVAAPVTIELTFRIY